jgi:hypothetical protein
MTVAFKTSTLSFVPQFIFLTSLLYKKPLIFFPFFHWMKEKGKKTDDAKLPYKRPPIVARSERHDS